MFEIGLGHYLTLGAIIFTIGLAIIVVYYRNSGTIRVEEINNLKG